LFAKDITATLSPLPKWTRYYPYHYKKSTALADNHLILDVSSPRILGATAAGSSETTFHEHFPPTDPDNLAAVSVADLQTSAAALITSAETTLLDHVLPTDPGSLVDGSLSVEVDHLMSMYMSCALSEQSNPLLLVPLHTQNISLPVDLLDSLIGLYRCKLRSENWYHRIFLHMCDLTVVNAWLLYKRILRANASEGRMMRLHEFKYAIAEGCVTVGRPPQYERC